VKVRHVLPYLAIICAYDLIDSLFPFFMDIRLILSEVVSRLNLTTLRRHMPDPSTY
jgi:hypothetical protein